MGQLIFSPQSREDIKAIYDYIKLASPLNAKRVRIEIITRCKSLVIRPEKGRMIIHTSVTSVRQVLVYKYRIFYRQINSDIEIISIFHGSRLIENNPGLQQFFEE